MKHIKASSFLQLLPVLAFVLSGCATESATEKDFGNSVRNMISQQKYHPEDEAPGYDGQKSRKVLDAYRTDVPKPAEVDKQIVNIKLD